MRIFELMTIREVNGVQARLRMKLLGDMSIDDAVVYLGPEDSPYLLVKGYISEYMKVDAKGKEIWSEYGEGFIPFIEIMWAREYVSPRAKPKAVDEPGEIVA